jgi:tetratricopeptide (TPR) repeat protein
MDMQIAYRGRNDEGQPLFEVVRLSDGDKRGPKVELTPPEEFPVEGVKDLTLLEGLRWYLEDFLETPYGAYLDRAEKIQESLVEWGRQCFDALFSKQAALWFEEARKTPGGLGALRLKVASDEPSVLAWPWEALRRPGDIELALECSIERQLSTVDELLPLPEGIRASNTINILYVISRPDGEGDVDYHSLVRSLTDYARGEGKGRVRIDVLRPPTFNELRDTLRKNPGYYHIVHFDGHGGYGELEGKWQGVLAFEGEKKEKDGLIGAEKLGTLLREHNIPVFVLNACQSAMIDGGADGPLASVAAALLKAGARSVVAMSHSLFVSAAKVFISAFYERLFEGADIAEALRAGRQQMYQDSGRPCMIGTYDLKDWLIPTLYQQLPPGESVLPSPTKQAGALSAGAAGVASGVQGEQESQEAQDAQAPQETQATAIPLPPEAEQLGDYPFLGRGQELLRLERAMRHRQAAILVHGMAGIGKTTLAKGFLQWLRDTGGLEYPPLWLAFDDIRSAESVINRCLKHLGFEIGPQRLETKLSALVSVLKERPVVMVWDNFESVSGIEGTEVTALLSDGDRAILKRLIYGLRGGKSRIIITSRSREDWLTDQECRRPKSIEGLVREDLWEYCNAVLDDIDPAPATDSEEFKALLDRLQGNPLYIRSVLLRMKDKAPVELSKELDAAFAGAEGDEATRHLTAALSVLDSGLDPSFAPVLQCIGLFDRYVWVPTLLDVLTAALDEDLAATADSCLQTLEKAGLGQRDDQLFRMHPALRGYLQSRHPADEALRSAFEQFMKKIAVQLQKVQVGDKQGIFALFGLTLYRLAEQVTDASFAAALWGVLASYFLDNRDFNAADALYQRILDTSDDDSVAASTYHQLGRVAEERRDLDTAEQWYKKSLEISLRQNDDYGAAATCHQLGIIAQERRDFDTAEQWYKKSLEIKLRQNNDYGAAITYHQLGMVAQERRDFDTAEQWYGKSLEIKLRQNDDHGTATTYHQLGRVAEEQGHHIEAGEHYLRAIFGLAKCNDEHSAAIALDSFIRSYQASDEQQQRGLLKLWEEAGLPGTPGERDAEAPE